MAASKENRQTGTPNDEPPGGFDAIGTPDIDGWWAPKENSIIYGQIVGRISIEDQNEKMRDVVLVQLKRPCADCSVDGEAGQLEEGQVCGVGVRAKLTDLLYYVEHKGECWIKATGQKKLKGNRTMWQFDCRARGKRATPPKADVRVSDSDDIPF